MAIGSPAWTFNWWVNSNFWGGLDTEIFYGVFPEVLVLSLSTYILWAGCKMIIKAIRGL